MIVQLLLYTVIIAAVGWFIGRPLLFKPLAQMYRDKSEHDEMVRFIERHGSDDDRDRLLQLRRRRVLLRLSVEEVKLAREALDAPAVREALLGGNIELEELDRLLTQKIELPPELDDPFKDFDRRLLESDDKTGH